MKDWYPTPKQVMFFVWLKMHETERQLSRMHSEADFTRIARTETLWNLKASEEGWTFDGKSMIEMKCDVVDMLSSWTHGLIRPRKNGKVA